MQVIGKVHLINETEAVGNNGFTKRLIVVKTDEQYPQLIPIDFVKDKTSLLDSYAVGQDVKVSVNMRGNEYNGKYYLNFQGWRIEPNADNVPVNAQQVANQAASNLNGEPDDLPF